MNLALPTNFVPLYEGLLRAVVSKLESGRTYCAFAPRCGGDYAGALMFYGRATNGWTDESCFRPEELHDPSWLADFAETVVRNAQKPICCPEGEAGSGPYVMRKDEKCDRDPMHWLKHDRTNVTERRSQYWRCVKEIVCQSRLGVTDAGWHRHIASSNLYKVSPQQRKDSGKAAGNPSGSLQKAQRFACARILLEEVKHFQPRCVVFLTEVNETAGYFSDFPECLASKLERNLGLKYVSAKGKVQALGYNCNIILAQHPQGKGRYPLAIAQEVCKAMSQL